MSGIDDFFPGSDGGRGPEPEDLLDAEQRRGTASRADDILDAVEGIRRDVLTQECRACGSDNTVIRGSSLMGGAQSLLCRDCRVEIPWASAQAADVKFGPVRAKSGPYYSGRPKSKPDPLQPAFRRRKKS